jgi:hypothetical protein
LFLLLLDNNLNIHLWKKIYIQATKYVKNSTYHQFIFRFRSQLLIVVLERQILVFGHTEHRPNLDKYSTQNATQLEFQIQAHHIAQQKIKVPYMDGKLIGRKDKLSNF